MRQLKVSVPRDMGPQKDPTSKIINGLEEKLIELRLLSLEERRVKGTLASV